LWSGTEPFFSGIGIGPRGPASLMYWLSSSASALFSSSPFLKALPCQPSLFSANEMPFPLSVRARIIVGWPLVARASA